MTDIQAVAIAGNKGVGTTSDVVHKMQRQAKVIRDVVAGSDKMRSLQQEYLPKEEGESVNAYMNRLSRSFLFNATGKTVADMTGKVFAKPIVLEKDVPDQIKQFCENIDLTGSHINVFARNAFYDAMQPGIGFFFVDMPPAVQRADGKVATLADEQQAGLRPYVTYIPLERVLGWKSTVVNGAEQLTQFRFMESVTEPDGEFLETTVDQVKVLEPGKWRTYRRSATSVDVWIPQDSGTISVDEIPIVPIYINRTGFMTAEPPLRKLAELNVAHWQSSSDQRNILHVARVPILFGAGFNPDDKLAIGPSTMVRSNDPQAKLTYVEHNGAAIGSGQSEIDSIEQQMQTMGLQLLKKPQAGSKTATGELQDSVRENSPLAMMATALQDALENVLDLMADFVGLEIAKKTDDKAGGSVIVNKDFGVQAQRNDLQQLLQVRLAGDISRETLWSEMQRRDYLSDSFDADEEADRIASEAPQLDGPPIDLNGNGTGNDKLPKPPGGNVPPPPY